jgi:hypothetical protein
LRKLHLVGLTTDRDGLIFTARKGSKSGGYIVPLDKKVLAAIAAASAQDNGEPEESRPTAAEVEAVPRRLRSESALTPREMQARLRAGRTIDEVAAEAGVDHEWVARFAVPILAEQAQVVELARGQVYAKPRLGESTEPLGSSVLQNLSDRGVFLPDDVAHSAWSAFQLHDSVWMVRFRYRSRGKDQEAQWEIDVPTGRLRARNRQASDLGYVGPDRWATAEEEDQPPQEAAPPPPRASRRQPAPAKRPAAKATPPPRRPAKSTSPSRATKSTSPSRATKSTSPSRATKSTSPTRASKSTAKAAPAAKKAVTRKAVARKATTKSAPRPAVAKSTTRRRPSKAVPAPEAGPAAGSGGVRMAVARVSTARVAASMATADREPWAAAVRAAGAGGRRPAVNQPAARDRNVETKPAVPFQPRPLPPPGSEPPEPRVRKITVQSRTVDGAPAAVTLPAPRRPAKDADTAPGAERPKRRRLRSR